MADIASSPDFKLLPKKQLYAAIMNPYDRIGWPDRTKEHIKKARWQIRETVASGINQGKSYPEVAKELKERLDITATKAQTIARTEAHRAREMGKLAATQDAADQGLIFKRRWVATLDQKTRDTHGAMDGQEIDVYDKDGNPEKFKSPGGGEAEFPGGFGVAALDINCRCTTVDIYEGFEPTERRTREDDMIEYTTYDKYAKAKGWPRPYAGWEPRVVDDVLIVFKPAGTVDEASAWAKKNLGIEADYRGMDVKMANEMNHGLTNSLNEFPEIRPHISAIKNTGRLGDKTWAFNDITLREGDPLMTGLIKTNKNKFGNDVTFLMSIDDSVNTGWFVGSKYTPRHIIAHEALHSVENEIMFRKLGLTIGDTVTGSQVLRSKMYTQTNILAGEVVTEAQKALGISTKDWGKVVVDVYGGYVGSSYTELMATALADAVVSKNPHPVSIEILKAAKKALR